MNLVALKNKSNVDVQNERLKSQITIIDNYITNKQYDSARQEVLKLLELYGDDNLLVNTRNARTLFFQGQSKVSLEIYDKIIANKSSLEVNDVRFYAISCAQNGRESDAERLFKSIIKRIPSDAATWENLLRVYIIQKRYGDALAAFHEIVQSDRVNNEILGFIYKELRKQNEVKRILSYTGILMAYYPRERKSYFDAAKAHLDMGNPSGASFLVKDARRGNTKSLIDGIDEIEGIIAAQEHRFTDAMALLSSAVEKDPDNIKLIVNKGKLLLRTRRFEEGIKFIEKYSDKYFESYKDYRDLFLQLYGGARQFEVLYKHAKKLFDKEPTRVENIDILSTAYLVSTKYEEGIEFLEQQLKRFGQPPARLFHRYISFLMQDCQHKKALEKLEPYIDRNPKDIRAFMQAAFAGLNVDEFEKGWKYYDSRLKMNDNGKYFIRHKGVMWNGESGKGKTILIVAEQGLGDVIMACRFLPQLCEEFSNVIFEVQKPIYEFLKFNFPNIKLFVRGKPLPKYDYIMQLMSIFPRLNVRPETMVGSKGYLTWDNEFDQYIKPDKFTVAFAWQGEANHPNDINRSFAFEHLKPLLSLAGKDIEFVSIQRGHYEKTLDDYDWSKNVIKMGGKLNSFCDTAGLLKKIDLVICCDSAPIHLAGSMGIDAWGLVNTPCEWRWTQQGEDNYWYDSLKIKRVSKQDYSWKTTLERVANDLKEYVSKRKKK